MARLVSLLPFLLSLSLVSSASVFSLTTDYAKPTEWTHSGSQAGGTMLFVDGTNLMTHDPYQVEIYVGDQICVFDHFLMKESYIECTVPPMPSSAKFPNVTISVLFNKQPVYISPSANPVFIYTPDKTAVVYGVCPAQQSPLRPLSFYGSWKTEGDNSLYMEIRAANRHMEFLPEFSTFQSWGSTFIATNLGDNQAGETDPTVRLAASYGFAKFHWTAKQYNLAGEPYLFKALAEVKSLSVHSGSIAGGLDVTITGAGFPNKTSQVTADIEGNACLVTSVTWDTVKCTTSARILTEPGPKYEGGSGLKHHLWYNKTKSVELVDSEADIADIVPMAESFPPNNDDVDWIFIERWVGFFKAPRTGDYTFYVSSDDSCEVWLSTDSTPENKAKIINFGSYTNFRDMLSRTSTRSTPIPLESGKLYYLEIWHQQWSGATHFSMGVQIPSPGKATGNNMPSVQLLAIAPAQLIREVQRVTITGTPTGGSIVFTYKGKASTQVAWPVGKTKWSCGDIITAMKDLGISSLSCAVPAIDKVAYDFTFTYAWTDLRGLIGAVLSSAQPAGLSAATTQVLKPSKPLTGTYRLTWKGVITGPIPLQTSPSSLQIQLNANFTDFGGNLLVAGYANADGVQMQFIFGDSLNPDGKVPLVSATAAAVLGPDEGEPVVTVTEAIPGSTNQFWWAVPNEFFRTIEDYPVLRIYANAEPAICRGNCAFEYSLASPTITAVTYASSVSMTGVNLRNSCDTISVSIGGTACPVTACSVTSIQCTQGVGLVGTYLPKVVIAGSGLAVLADGLGTVTYLLAITSVSPATGSIGGGTLLTIQGTGFLPAFTYPGVEQSVKIGDSLCVIKTTSATSLTCITKPQTTTSTITLKVGSASDTDTGFTYDPSSSPTITSVSPLYASTIVKTVLTITGTQFTPAASGAVTVFIGSVECYVTASTDTSITCSLLGGPTGEALMVVSIPGKGNAVKEKYPLTFQLTSVSPVKGSVNGGTLLTLTGKGFSTRASQMLVMFVDKANLCDIVGTPTEQEVKCRTTPMGSLKVEDLQETVLLGRLQDEAVCAGTCGFTYSASATPIITSLSVATGPAGTAVDIIGTGFGTDKSLTTVLFGSQSATISSLTSTTVSVQVPNQEANQYNITLRFDDLGTASGAFSFTQTIQVTNVSPITGSQAGTDVTVTGSGFASAPKVTFGSVACQIISASASSIKCRLGASTSTTALLMSITQVNSYICTDASLCGFTPSSGSTPAISSASLSGNTLSVIGSKLSTTFTDIRVNVGQVPCTVSASTLTSITASCTPPSGTQPLEVFVSGMGYASGKVTVATTFTASGATGQGSFGGGNAISITGNGLGPNTNVTVCGFPCPIITATYTALTCASPVLPSDFSQPQYDLIPSDTEIQTGFTSSTPASGHPLSALFDSNYTTYFSSSVASCYLLFDSGVGRKTLLSSFHLYPAEDSLNTYRAFVGTNLSYSDDNVTWSLVYTYDVMYAGWNYYNVPLDQSADDNYPVFKARFFKLTPPDASKCKLAAIQFLGVTTQTDTGSTLNCPVNALDLGASAPVVAGSFTYLQSATPTVTAVTPTTGTIIGGTVLIFTGTLLSGVTGVSIDGVTCAIGTKSATSFTCTTGARTALRPPSIQIATSSGNAVIMGVTFLYADRWSESTTWGGEVPPKKGETVQIPVGMTILLDVPTPELMLLLIEGALIVEDKAGITLDANYIFINAGSFQVGTPTHPFQNAFTLTLHGRRASPMIPIYGNKVLAVYCGVLDMHGIPRSVTWTSLAETILPQATTLKVMVATDWKVGESIVVASTSFEHTEAEQRTITAITGGTDITVDQPFKFKHYAATETYGSKKIEIRAEVGLLSRNIKITGSVEGTEEEHGAHVMAYAPGDDRVVARISYVEIFNAGQAYSVGAYPFHFHMIGAVRNSYILGNSIHHTYNRAVTIHSIRYLRVIENVTYHTKGHSIFVEDGAETKNRIERNLVISVRRSWSRLNTDTTPAGIWVTNPDNYVIGNHVAGTDAYGIWFDFHPNPTGPSATTLICPFGTPLGEFRDNVAHSVEKYGFRLFHGHVPLTYPCKPALNLTASDPWADNPPVTAYYRNFLGYKCRRNGAIADKIGDVRWVNFTVADNILAGIEITYTMDTPPFTIPFLSDSLIIGKSGNYEADVDISGSIGFIGPQSDGFLGQNIAFFNFDDKMFALGDESHSQACTTRDFGGRHNQLKGLSFTNSNKRVHWEYPRRSFYEILDDSMTGHAGAYVAAFWPHLLWDPYCVYSETYNGIVCDGSKVLRRVHMLNLQPSTTFFLMQITVRRAAGDSIPLSTAPVSPSRFLVDATGPDYWWSSMEPVGGAQYHGVPKAWAVPMIMNTEYLVHWGTTPMDWTFMTIRIETFDDPSLSVLVRYNFTDHREMFQVRRGVIPAGTNTSAPNFIDPTLLPTGQPLSPSSLAGASTFDNITAMEFKVMLTGKAVPLSNSGDLTVNAFRCFGTHCVISNVTENVTMEEFKRVWSNPAAWPSGNVPVSGERVTILPEWTMILDCNTAILSFLEVNGVLLFDNNTSVTLTSDIIHVRKGKILSGSPEYPLQPNVKHQIVISGTFTSIAYAFDPSIEVVNKAFIVTGEMKLYGARRKAWVHLAENANPGESVIFVERVNWQPGDQIVLASSSFYANETEVAVIAAVEAGIDLKTGLDQGQSLASDTLWQLKESTKGNGRYKSAPFPNTFVTVDPRFVTKLTLASPLQYYHAGTILQVNDQSMDMRAEVGVLTSNIVIRGTENGWACNFVVADFVDYDVINSNPIRRTGTVTLDSIAIDYCGQNSTLRTGLRFESTTLLSTVTNSIVMRSQTYSVNIQKSQNIRLIGNNFFYAVRFGVFIQSSQNLLLDGNLMINVTQRPTVSLPFDKPTGFVICPEETSTCSNITLTRNVAAGYALLGFAVAGSKCGATPTFYDNVAHSGYGGWITSNIDGGCMEMSGFTTYFNMETAVVGSMDIPKMTIKNLRLAENFNGYGGNMGGIGDYGNIVTIKDSLIIGSTAHSLCNPKECFTPQCGNRRGITLGSYQESAKQWTINGKLKLPMYNVSKEEVFHAEFFYTNLVFVNFNLTTECGSNASVVAANELCPDYTPLSTFAKTKLINVANDSIFAMAEPDPVWANIIFCGEFPCTGLKNAIVRDLDGGLVGGSTGGYLLPNNTGITYQNACTYINRSNGYLCQKSPINDFDYALLVFENMDADARNVTISPTYVISEDPVMNVNSTHFYNKLNSYMSHVWDGFYVGMNRLGRFVSAIGVNRAFNISFTAIAPNNLRFQLQGTAQPTDGVLLTVDYKTPYTVVVAINETSVPPLPFNRTVNLASPSGANQWLNKDRMLQFMLRPYDMITLKRVDSIQVSVRMNMTTEEFFASNGPTEFVDRLAAVLGIPPYRIRVVEIKSGSTIVDFIFAGDEKLASQQASNANYSNAMQEELLKVNNLLVTLAQNGSLVLNGPVLSIETKINFTTPGNVTSNTPTVITPIDTTPITQVPVEAGDGSEDDPVLPWWVYLLIGIVVLVIIAVGLYFLYRRVVRRTGTVSVPQPTIAFEKIKADKEHEAEFDVATSQRSGRMPQKS